MCGPIGTFAARSSPSGLLSYQAGRSLSYAAAGAGAGLLGQPLVRLLWGSDITTALSWALALLMAVAAYRAWPRKPTSELVQISKRPAMAADESLVVRLLQRFPHKPALLGACSALIPCVALWSGLVIAASSASPLSGSLAMLAFSLTSGTGLLASSFLASKLRNKAGRGRLLSLVFAAGALILVLRPLGMHQEANATSQQDESSADLSCPLHPEGM
jgi:sulfite exporter TauE/SafE